MKTFKSIAVICILACGLMLWACDSTDNSPDGDIIDGDVGESESADTDADEEIAEEEMTEEDSSDGDITEQDAEEEAPVQPVNTAMVFPVNPVATPDMIEVDLPAADDAEGTLTSPEVNGLRRLKVYTCADEGKTNTINMGDGPQTQRICTLVQRANKEENNNFIYDDYTRAVAGEFDPDDRHAEVEAFYHASKFYDFFADPAVGVFDTIPNRHGNDNAPINLVVNFQVPTPEGSDALQPLSMAMYLPRDMLARGMGAIYGLTGPTGDIIVLGQGAKADFAYDGETIYHEMGHLMNQALVDLEYTISFDRYGMSALENALEQGLSETMTSLVCGKSGLFDYIDLHAGPGFFRDADNDLTYPEGYRGVDQGDAMILAGAMWDTFAMLRDAGLSNARVTRLLLLAMQSLDASEAELTFAHFASAFITALNDEGLTEHQTAVQTIFDTRGLMNEERARTLAVDGDQTYLKMGGAYKAMWNKVLDLELDSGTLPVATALIQLKTETMAQERSCTLSAKPRTPPGSSSMYPVEGQWDLRLFTRAGEAITYTKTSSWKATVAYDELLDPQTGDDGTVQYSFTVPADTVMYLHPVNAGVSPLFLMNIQLTCE